MTQHERIIAYLKKNGSITQTEASINCSCSKLSTRLGELRTKKGYKFTSEWETSPNQFGEDCTYLRYRLVEESEQ